MTFGFLTKQQSADLFVTITNNCTNSLPRTLIRYGEPSITTLSRPEEYLPYAGTPTGTETGRCLFSEKKTDRIDYGPSPQHLYNPHYTNSLFAIYSGRSGMSCLERNLFPLQRKEKIEPFQKETHD